MAKRPAYKFTGSDAARARALAGKPRKPKFALGEVVLDAFGDIGAVEAIYADMRAVEDAGLVSDAAEWRKRLAVKAKTSNSGIFYAIACGEGQGVAGEDDLKKAPAGSSSKP